MFIRNFAFAVAIVAFSSASQAFIVERGGPAFDPVSDITGIAEPIPAGEIIATVDRQFTYTRQTFLGPNGELGDFEITATVRNSVLREASGTLTFIYEPLPVTSTPQGIVRDSNYEYNDLGFGGFGGDGLTVDVWFTGDIPSTFALPRNVAMTEDGTIFMSQSFDEIFLPFHVRTNATMFDENGSISFLANAVPDPGDVEITMPGYAPVVSVTAVPLPPAAWPALATMFGVGVTAMVARRQAKGR